MFWDIYGQTKIRESHNKAVRAVLDLEELNIEFENLERRFSTLSLACHAMWEIIQEKLEVSTEDLLDRMEQIDLRDGAADGQVGPRIRVCPKCGRKASRRHTKCIYCGEPLPQVDLFEGT